MSAEMDALQTKREIVLGELEKHGAYASTTRGVSMWPLLKTHRDVVILEKPSSPPKRYDVVLYPGKNGRFLLHRIIGEREDEYLIRGDNTFHTEHVKKSEIVAVMTAFNRNGKRHTTSERGYKAYVRTWNFIYPIRYPLFRLRCLLSKIKRKMLGK